MYISILVDFTEKDREDRLELWDQFARWCYQRGAPSILIVPSLPTTALESDVLAVELTVTLVQISSIDAPSAVITNVEVVQHPRDWLLGFWYINEFNEEFELPGCARSNRTPGFVKPECQVAPIATAPCCHNPGPGHRFFVGPHRVEFLDNYRQIKIGCITRSVADIRSALILWDSYWRDWKSWGSGTDLRKITFTASSVTDIESGITVSKEFLDSICTYAQQHQL